jgi:hypothetical protein
VSLPKQRDGLFSTSVDDELIIFDPVHNQTHRLHRLARHVWDRCDGSHDRAALIEGLLADAPPGLPEAEAAEIVDATFAGLAEQNLLAEPGATGGRAFSRRAVARTLVASLVASLFVPSRAAAESCPPAADCSEYTNRTCCTADPNCVWLVQICVPNSVNDGG